jgi:hypothetical protein
MRSVAYWQSNPSRSEDASKLAVRKESDFSVQIPKTGYEPVGTVGYLSRHFTSRTTVAEDIPIRTFLANVRRAPSFIIPVIPFSEVQLDFSALTQAN